LSSNSGGVNFGWRCYEGNSTFIISGCGSINDYTFPVEEYEHSGTPFRCSITGGYRYRGNSEPTLAGLYFFADFCSNEIGYVEETSPNMFKLNFINTFGDQSFSSFVEDVNGEVYVIGLSSGVISKIIDANLSINENEHNEISLFPNPANHKVNIQLGGSDLNTIRIMNIQGKIMKSINDFSDHNIHISVEDFEKGIYLLDVNFDNRQTIEKKLFVN
jgi:hypothetical protein